MNPTVIENLSPKQYVWLGLMALMPEGVRSDAIERVCRHGHLIPRSERWRVDEIGYSLSEAGIPVPHHVHMGFQLTDPSLRSAALDWLCRGTAAIWGAKFDALLVNTVWNHQFSFDIPQPVILCLRLAMLAGVGHGGLTQALLRFPSSLVQSAMARSAQNLMIEPVDERQLLLLHATVRLDLTLRKLANGLTWPVAELSFWRQQTMHCIEPIAAKFVGNRTLLEDALLRRDQATLQRFGAGTELAPVFVAGLQAMASDHAQALTALQSAYEASTPQRGSSRLPLPGLTGVMHAMALAAEPTALNLIRLNKVIRGLNRDDLGDHALAIVELGNFARACATAQAWSASFDRPVAPLLLGWVHLLLHHWSGKELPSTLRQWASAQQPRLRLVGWDWLAEQFAGPLGLSSAPPIGPLAWRQAEAPWERALRAIESYARPHTDSGAAPKYSRIRVSINAHHLDPDKLFMEVREQRPGAKGSWSSGRLIDAARAATDAQSRIDPDDAQTLQLLQQWQRALESYHNPPSLSAPVVDALIGYPQVYAVHSDQALQVLRRTPKLRIQRDAHGHARVAIDPPATSGAKRVAQWQGDRLLLTDFDADTLRLAGALGDNTELPESALPALLALAPQLSRRIEVDADFGATATVATVDSRIHVVIEPLREGLRLRLRTRPLGTDGVYFVPASGPTEILGLRDGTPVRARRALADEQAAVEQLIAAIPTLAGGEAGDEIDIAAAETALETLSQLLDLGDSVLLDWSQHRRWALSRRSNPAQLSIKVRAQRDWFHAEGGLTLDDGQVVSLASLLEALPSSQGRFVRLADERIIALSQELARQLRQVRALADERGRLQLAPVAAAALQPLLDSGVDIDLDQAFQAQLQRIAQAENSQAELPRDLQAELRDYQVEGFRWLMRLASWGAGACLADDMGLGKTLQALAMLLARASIGPALVVAPTSVVANWRSEAERFAPALNIRVYGEGDRSLALDQLGSGAVILVSYGLLTLNIERFAEHPFATLVLDEAQAIKNAAAQRTLAIRRIQAEFRVATTGTPIENHLGELWSLMRVLNPGLLGSQEHFAKRFIAPIERNPRGAERESLRRLIGPFMLRRLKSQVLAELPPRTEIVLTIEPSAGEAKLLAAVRRQALERLESGGLPEEAKRFHVLAEIMRLRRAACHPSLVAPELNLSGAKLEQLLELVHELKDNRHRALVFSQFVDYLALVRAAFDQAGISYQYLDGSTSVKARETAVKAFQAGQGDVFLLSLKAGGVGLNLTAADYVIHLDPWWNPAVEQQATDRAHRIGQTRPVTVYKLVVKGSIEEQILALHGSKREIADSVLADQDVATRLNVGELIGLLQADGGDA